jgi:membrane protease YdiL (CAAX protease family)
MSTSSFLFLLLVGLWLPLAAWRSSQRLGTGPVPLTPSKFFLNIIATQLFLLLLGLGVAWKNGIALWSLPRHPLASWGAAALLFALLVTTLKLRWHARPVDQKRRLYSMLPHNARELRLFAIVALCAGIGEEIVYRGVFTSIIWWSTGNLMVAGLLSAIAFGLAHIIQGWRAVVTIFGIALISQALVTFSGSLLPIMAVHAIYDFVAGIVIPRWYERDLAAAPSDSTPSAAAPAAGQ